MPLKQQQDAKGKERGRLDAVLVGPRQRTEYDQEQGDDEHCGTHPIRKLLLQGNHRPFRVSAYKITIEGRFLQCPKKERSGSGGGREGAARISKGTQKDEAALRRGIDLVMSQK